MALNALANGTEFDQESFNSRCFSEIELPWQKSHHVGPMAPVGCAIKEATRISKVYLSHRAAIL